MQAIQSKGVFGFMSFDPSTACAGTQFVALEASGFHKMTGTAHASGA